MSSISIPHSVPQITSEEENAVLDCLRSGWLTSGPRVEEFENEFTKYLGCQSSVATSSGTAAIHLALTCIGLKPGDEVITPSFTWVSVPNILSYMKAKPVFADIDSKTLTIDPYHVESLVTPKTKAIVPMHYAGYPSNLDAIHDIARKNNLIVIEDACHALGAKYYDQSIGSYSSLSIFSFHPTKQITTAEGGMLCGTNSVYLEKARKLRNLGLTKDSHKRHHESSIPSYQIIQPFMKYIMSDLAASIGIMQIRKLEKFRTAREQIANLYKSLLQPLEPEIELPEQINPGNHRHGWYLFPILVKNNPGWRDSIVEQMRSKNIGVGIHYPPVHEMEWFQKNNGPCTLPITEHISRRIITLPFYPSLQESELEIVVNTLKTIIGQGKHAK